MQATALPVIGRQGQGSLLVGHNEIPIQVGPKRLAPGLLPVGGFCSLLATSSV
jgi:hypothetical protein